MARSITLPIAALLLAFVASAAAQQERWEEPHDQKERALWVQNDHAPVHNRDIHSWWHPQHGEFKIHQRNHMDIQVLNNHQEYGVLGVQRPNAVVVISDNYPGHYWNVRTDDEGGGQVDELWKDPVMASPFRIVQGLAVGDGDNSSPDCLVDLAPGCVVSFMDEERGGHEGMNDGYYLRHTASTIVVNKNDETPQFAEDATWIIREALDNDPSARSYESVNRSYNYVRHHASRLRLHSSLNLPRFMFQEDCSFKTLNVQDLINNSDRAPPAVAD